MNPESPAGPKPLVIPTAAELADATPLMRQFWELKAAVPDALLLFRMGDFYELFGDDAVEAARLLEITLTSRDKNKENALPMAGVPHHSIQGYIQRLLDFGKKVAIGEQVEDPEEAKKRGAKSIVRREITRVFTPAVQFDAEGSQIAYLATAIAVAASGTKDRRYTLACVDPSTGEARLSLPLDEKSLGDELASLPIRHFLRFGHDLPESAAATLSARAGLLFEDLPSNRLSLEQARIALREQYAVQSLEAFLEGGADLDSSTHALAIAVDYLKRSQKLATLPHLRTPAPLHGSRLMKLGPRAAQHLDLFSEGSLAGGPAAAGATSLFARVCQTRSAPGARLYKRWMQEPLRAPAEIATRQEAARDLSAQSALSAKISALLGEVYDLERILARAHTGLASPRDSYALGRTLSALASVDGLLAPLSARAFAAIRGRARDAHGALKDLADEILRTQKAEAPLVARDGGIFLPGTTPELDRLIDLTENGQRWLVELEAREREATGIPSLKVRYNRVFGYYIEITSAHLKSAPAHYQRKQTTVGAERFFTDELKKFEEEMVTAVDRQKALEQELFAKLLERVRQRTAPIQEAAALLAELDAFSSLARLAQEPGWVFPRIDDSMDFEIRAGRHPLVDQGRGNFVPNDTVLGEDSALTLLITGPNMGGKSTVMRQAALIVVLGQMGAPIPAASARWGAVSSIHTRIGAHDAIARGQSTFMVEMTELAHILHHADARSLVVLDEIGRGTSTYDGISVAWATIEWIAKNIGCRTLFATHYHELTVLPNFLPRVANAHMAVESKGTPAAGGGGFRFLYVLRPGATLDSFGIQVAKLAGLPMPVIQRAWKVLDELEGKNAGASQMSLFGAAAPATDLASAADSGSGLAAGEVLATVTERIVERFIPSPIEAELKTLDLNAITPKGALDLLYQLQENARNRADSRATE